MEEREPRKPTDLMKLASGLCALFCVISFVTIMLVSTLAFGLSIGRAFIYAIIPAAIFYALSSLFDD